MMTTLYARVPDEATGRAMLEAAGFYVDPEADNSRRYFQSGEMIVDVIGAVVDQPAALDGDGVVVTPATYLPGVHFNVYNPTPEVAALLAPYTIDPPATPLRVLAGS